MLSAPLLKLWTSPKYAGLLEYGGSYAGAYLLRRGLFMPWELPEVLDADLARTGWQDLQTDAAIARDVVNIDYPRSKVSSLESCWYMKNQLLRDADWAGMAHSLEIRVPLVDLELLRSTGKSMANGNAPTKLNLAETPRRPLPASILSRPKTGFSVPVREWLIPKAGISGDAASSGNDRGLRGWSKIIYRQFLKNPI